MAIGSLSQFTRNTEWKEVIESGFQSIVFRNNHFLPLFRGGDMSLMSRGGDRWSWRVNTAANTSAEVYTEGAAEPAAVAQTYTLADLDYIYFRVKTEVTGHLRDAIRGLAVPEQFNVIAQEAALALEDLRDLINTTFMGTTNNGLGLAIDSTGTYAGIDKSATTGWASYEQAASSAWTDLTNARRSLIDAERGSRPDLILADPTEEQTISQIPGTPGAANNSFRVQLAQTGGAQQLAPTIGNTMVGEMRVVGIPNAPANTLFVMMSSDVEYRTHRPFEVRRRDPGDNDVEVYTHAGTLIVRNPQKHGKVTGY